MTLDELVAKWNEQAKIHVERAMVVRDIFEKENLQLTNADLNTELFHMAGEYNVPAPELLQQLQTNNAVPELQFRAISRKVTDFLLASASVGEAGAAPTATEEPTAKKPRAKKAVASTDAVPEEATPVTASDAPEEGGGEAPKAAPKRKAAKKTDASSAPESEGQAGA